MSQLLNEAIILAPSYNITRVFSGCCLLLVVSLSVYLSGGGGHGAQSIDASNPGLKYIDPSVALLAIIIMVASSGAICRESCLILLQTIPAHLDVAELKADLFARFPTTVLNIHDMHIWCLVPGNVVVTMHVIFQSKQVWQCNKNVIIYLRTSMYI